MTNIRLAISYSKGYEKNQLIRSQRYRQLFVKNYH